MLPFGGQTVLEFQTRVAHAAGAAHIVVMVSNLPGEMVAAFDRLRASGINVDVARDPRDAADRIHPDERLIVMSDGVVADRYSIAELSASTHPTLLTIEDAPRNAGFERIDSTERWSGLAMIDGELLRETVAMLGDWTLSPTLLRAALQAGALRRRVSGGSVVGRAIDQGTAQGLAAQMAAQAATKPEGPLATHVAEPLAARALPILLKHGVPLDLLSVLPIVLAASSLLLSVMGWFASGFLVLLLAMLPAAAGRVVAAMSARSVVSLTIYDKVKDFIFCAGIVLLGWHEYQQGLGWGAVILALWAVVLLLHRRISAPWPVHVEVALVVMLVTVLAGVPLWGIGLIIAAFVMSDQITARTSN